MEPGSQNLILPKKPGARDKKLNMQDVPKIVSERLKAATPAVNHPDADALTAFSERSLPELERDIVLEHLARCGECREVVALALPAMEQVDAPILPAPGGWLAWPVLRWGFVSAGIILVASLGIVLYQRQTRHATMAYRTAAPTMTATVPQGGATPAAPAADSSERDKIESPTNRRLSGAGEGKVEDKKVAEKEIANPAMSLAPSDEPVSAPAPQAGGVVAGDVIRRQLAHGPRLANQQAQQNAYAFQNQTQPTAAPLSSKQQLGGTAGPNARAAAPVSQSVEVSGQAAALDSTSQAQDAMVLRGESIPLQPSPGGSGGVVVNRAKEPGTVVVGSVEVPGGSMSSQSAGSAFGGPVSIPSARWNINSAGALQRSLDQGNTWQDVNVNAPSAATTGMSYAVAKSSPAKAKDSLTPLKREAIAPTFRAVAANGADVWAGGSGGMLYHSSDSGATWTRIIPSSYGATLTGDIVALEFPDSIHGKISTSTPEVWITTDAGLTWQKQ